MFAVRRVRVWWVAALAALGILGLTLPGEAARAGTPKASPAASCPWVTSHASIARRVAQLMSHMTLSDEIFLVEGHGTTNESANPSPNPYVFWMPGISRLCIPKLGEEDGPAGVADELTNVTQLPAPVALAATFDSGLANKYGQVIGSEEAGKGADVNLGPTVNIDRDPRWGRSFEAFTEDPYLNSALAVSEINGVQARGEMSQVKHFDAYNQETNRNTSADQVVASDRTLHEIYMPAFQAAIQRAKASSVMCSYSSVKGTYACQSPYLLTTTLRNLWGFPGFVTSDYGALHSTSGATAGTDQEQPENTYYGTPLQNAVMSGAVSRAVVNTMVSRMLTEMFRFHLFTLQRPATPTRAVDSPQHRVIANDVAQNGTVLLRNESHLLPISSTHAGKVAVIGPSASPSPTDGGGGSAYVVPPQTVTPLAGLQKAAKSGTHITYTQGLPTDTSLPPIPASDLSPAYAPTKNGATYTGTLTAPETGTYVLAFTNPCGCYSPEYLSLNGTPLLDNPGTPPTKTFSVAVNLVKGQHYTLTLGGGGQSSDLSWGTPSALAPGLAAAAAAAKSAKDAVVVVSDNTESEATDRLSLNLPSAQDELISTVAAANPRTVVVVDAGAPIAMPWLNHVASIVDAWYPGQTNGTALANVLYGKVDPNGHLPVSFPTTLAQVPASKPAQFPGVGGKVLYSEGLEVGYRYYDAHNLNPVFPFGFGLSYTTFKYSHLSVQRTGGGNGAYDVNVSATVTNTGHLFGGADVAQLYLGDPAAAHEPPRELVGFSKVALRPGHSTRVHFTITPQQMSWWSQSANGWAQSTGVYRVYVGDSSALTDLPLRGAYIITRTPGARQVVVHAPRRIRRGHATLIAVQLTRGGNETLSSVRFALQVPQGWKVRTLAPVTFRRVRPGQRPTAVFIVTAPRWEPQTNATVHATAALSPNDQREAGVTVPLR